MDIDLPIEQLITSSQGGSEPLRSLAQQQSQRIVTYEKFVNAFTYLDLSTLERFICGEGRAGPLAGLSVGYKDVIDVAEQPTSGGVPGVPARIADKDSAVA